MSRGGSGAHGRICRYCKEGAVRYDETTFCVICEKCGFVLDQAIVSEAATWSKSAPGRPEGVSLSEENAAHCEFFVDENEESKSKMRQVNVRKRARAKAERILAQLKCQASYAQDAIRLLQRIGCGIFSKEKWIEARISCCVYIILRQNNLPVTLLDVAEASGVSIYKLGKYYKETCQTLQISLAKVEITELLSRRADDLQAYVSTQEELDTILQNAARLLRVSEAEWLGTGRKPHPLCGAAVKIAAEAKGIEIRYEDLATIFKCGVISMRDRVKEMKALIMNVCTSLPWGQDIHDKNLTSYLEFALKHIEPLRVLQRATLPTRSLSKYQQQQQQYHQQHHHQQQVCVTRSQSSQRVGGIISSTPLSSSSSSVYSIHPSSSSFLDRVPIKHSSSTLAAAAATPLPSVALRQLSFGGKRKIITIDSDQEEEQQTQQQYQQLEQEKQCQQLEQEKQCQQLEQEKQCQQLEIKQQHEQAQEGGSLRAACSSVPSTPSPLMQTTVEKTLCEVIHLDNDEEEQDGQVDNIIHNHDRIDNSTHNHGRIDNKTHKQCVATTKKQKTLSQQVRLKHKQIDVMRTMNESVPPAFIKNRILQSRRNEKVEAAKQRLAVMMKSIQTPLEQEADGYRLPEQLDQEDLVIERYLMAGIDEQTIINGYTGNGYMRQVRPYEFAEELTEKDLSLEEEQQYMREESEADLVSLLRSEFAEQKEDDEEEGFEDSTLQFTSAYEQDKQCTTVADDDPEEEEEIGGTGTRDRIFYPPNKKSRVN